MRALVIVLLLLAATKVGYQQYVVSTAKTDIIVTAYREKGAGACERASKLNLIGPSPVWSKADDVRLVIGKGSLDVSVWQLDHSLWTARNKNAYLFFTLPGRPQKVFCEFDIVQGVASVYRM